MTRDNYLLGRASIFDVLEGQERAVKKAVENLEANCLLSIGEHDFISPLVKILITSLSRVLTNAVPSRISQWP
jgi:hypothetical protein